MSLTAVLFAEHPVISMVFNVFRRKSSHIRYIKARL